MNRIGNSILVASFSWLLSGGIACVGLADDSGAGQLIHRSGKHIKLTTDIDDVDAINDLISAFDASVGQWESFWKFPAGTLDQFQVDACVIGDKAIFMQQGLIPPSVPNFPFGYALGNRVWVIAQDSPYYTRHLLLHEGAHALAYDRFGGTGPSWFMEGTAEMLAVHQGAGRKTIINQVPNNRESVPYWGRFKVLQHSRQAKKIPSLATVMAYPRDLKSDVESYGWSWAATMMLYEYPDTRDAFFTAAKHGTLSDAVFNNDLRRSLQNDWPVITARWRLMCHDLDYGFDWPRERVSLSMNDRNWDGRDLLINVMADRGWQSIGVRLAAGMKLNVTPAGQCTLAKHPKPWTSTPTGVTIRYQGGRPLGQLLACLVPNTPANDQSKPVTILPLQVAAITRAARIPIKENCWLLFRVNDAPGELSDNQGSYQLKITAAK